MLIVLLKFLILNLEIFIIKKGLKKFNNQIHIIVNMIILLKIKMIIMKILIWIKILMNNKNIVIHLKIKIKLMIILNIH